MAVPTGRFHSPDVLSCNAVPNGVNRTLRAHECSLAFGIG